MLDEALDAPASSTPRSKTERADTDADTSADAGGVACGSRMSGRSSVTNPLRLITKDVPQ